MPTRPITLATAIESITVHDHLCLIHTTVEEQLAAVLPFVRHGLALGERCVYVADAGTGSDIVAALDAAGVDTAVELARGALQVLGQQDAYLRGGGFDPEEMIAYLAAAEQAARDDGFSALRITDEMGWVLSGEPGTERLIEYESLLDRFFPEHDALALCQYDRSRFPPDIIRDVIRLHPLVISGSRVCDNPYYVPPNDALLPEGAGVAVDRMLGTLEELSRSRSALEDASRHWSATFDALNDAVCLLTRDGTVIRCNRSMTDLLGLESAEVVGRKCYELMHGGRAFFDGCPYREMLRTGRRESLELPLGDSWYQVTADPMLGAKGEIVGAVHVVRDIADRRRAEDALAERSGLLAAIRDLAVDLASLPGDADLGRFLAERLRELTGAVAVAFSEYLPDDRVLATRTIALQPGAVKTLTAPLMRRLAGTRSPVDEETYRSILTTSSATHSTLTETSFGAIPPAVDVAVRKLLGVDRFVGLAHVVEGALYGTAVIALKAGAPDPPLKDLEAFAHLGAVSLRRRRAETALRESESRARFWADIVESAADAVAIGYPDGRIGDCNQAWCELTGYSREELQVVHWTTDLTPPEWLGPEREALTELERTGKPVRYHKEIVRKDGRRLPVELVVHLQTDQDGSNPHYTGFIRDMSEQKRAEERIRDLNAELERRVHERTRELTSANRQLQEFVYSVAHDLRTPLRAIDGFSLAVMERSDALHDADREDLRRVRGAAQRLGRVIDGMVSLASVGRREPRPQTTDLSALAAEVVAELRAEHPGREVEVDIQEGLIAETDALLAEVVLANLLGNAWKFTSPMPVAHIAVGALTRDGRRAYYVRDDGVGFDPAYAHKLFVPFESLHTAGEFPGTGVGLATVARTLESLGGTCWAEGRPGEGATFYFVLSEDAAQE